MYEIDHIGVIVKDPEEAAKFYCENFGAKIIRRHLNERVNLVFVSSGTGVIEFIHRFQEEGKAQHGQIEHIAYRVPNMEDAINDLKKNKITFISEAPAPFGNDRIFFFKGLNGEKLEYVEKGK